MHHSYQAKLGVVSFRDQLLKAEQGEQLQNSQGIAGGQVPLREHDAEGVQCSPAGATQGVQVPQAILISILFMCGGIDA